MACWAIASSVASQAQTLIDFDLSDTGGNGQAVLGGTSDTYNTYGPGSGNTTPAASVGVTTQLVSNAVSSTGASTAVNISTSTGFNTYVDTSNSPNPDFLMDGYAYNSGNSPFVTDSSTTAFTLSGLTGYDGRSFTLVVYGAGNNSGQGDVFTLSGASTATGSTSGEHRSISYGVGDAYQEFTGTITGDTLTITAASNDTYGGDGSTTYTIVNGFQLSIAAVPEPSCWAMMIGGLALLFVFGRFRSRAQA